MRRSTHAFCAYCMMNLTDYGQVQCDRCFIRLNDDRIVFSLNPSTKIGFVERVKCFFESIHNKAFCITFV